MKGRARAAEGIFQEICKLPCICFRIVFPQDQGVLKGDAALGDRIVINAGVKQLFYLPLIVHGHDLRALLIGCGVERDGEGDGDVHIRKSADLGHDAAGGQRDMTVADIDAVGVVYKAKKFDNIIVVIEGLADAHHNDI